MAHFARLVIRSTLQKSLRNNMEFKQSIRLNTGAAVVGEQGNDNIVKKKFANLMIWYEQVTGMDEVRLAQNRVLEAEENFVTAQERRREASKEVATIQAKLRDIHGELDNTSRGEERYVQLITQEHRILKEERRLTEDFSRYEREERDYFSSLSTAVKDSHEKERAQAEKTKYWSIIGSIIGTVIGILGSSINNEIKMKQLRRLVQDSLVKKEIESNVPEALTRHERELSLLITEIKNITNQEDLVSNDVSNRHRDKISDASVKTIMDALSHQEVRNNNYYEELKAIVKAQSVQPELKGDQLVVMPVGLEDRLNEQYRWTQYIVIGTTVVTCMALPIMKYIGML